MWVRPVLRFRGCRCATPTIDVSKRDAWISLASVVDGVIEAGCVRCREDLAQGDTACRCFEMAHGLGVEASWLWRRSMLFKQKGGGAEGGRGGRGTRKGPKVSVRESRRCETSGMPWQVGMRCPRQGAARLQVGLQARMPNPVCTSRLPSGTRPRREPTQSHRSALKLCRLGRARWVHEVVHEVLRRAATRCVPTLRPNGA